jgi:hypothetical protein
MTWEKFEKLRKTKGNTILADRENDDIFYESKKCLNAGLSLRAKQCPMYECKLKNQNFANVESLRKHLE